MSNWVSASIVRHYETAPESILGINHSIRDANFERLPDLHLEFCNFDLLPSLRSTAREFPTPCAIALLWYYKWIVRTIVRSQWPFTNIDSGSYLVSTLEKFRIARSLGL